MLIFVAPVRYEGATIGICYLEFDFEGQAGSIMNVINKTATNAVASIVDVRGNVVATTGSYGWQAKHPHASTDAGTTVRSTDGLNIAQSHVTSDHGISDLNLRCIIEEHVATEQEIVAALAQRRR